ncbi:MAG: hypothetical protein ACXADC_09675 [Candidatus Thorarchaeota archaeon]|jgi:hypothetical protein
MKVRLARIIGKALAIIGTPLFLFFSYGVFVTLSSTIDSGQLHPAFALVSSFALLSLGMIGAGVLILLRFEKRVPLLVKGGEPIHSGDIWKKRTESGLYLTSCGRVVSTSQKSRATAHTGYRIASAKGATCKDCVISIGKPIMESGGAGRDGG